MIVWLLLLCSRVEGGFTCLPPQEFATQKQCVSVGNSYVALTTYEGRDYSLSKAKCMTIRKPAK